jgi:hypothetical protein
MLLCIIGRTYDEVKTAKQDHAEDRMAHEFHQGRKGSRSRLFFPVTYVFKIEVV